MTIVAVMGCVIIAAHDDGLYDYMVACDELYGYHCPQRAM